MNSNEQILTSLLHAVQMGQSGIDCVLDQVENSQLRQQLLYQRSEYDQFEQQAKQIAAAHGWCLKDICPATVKMSQLVSRMKLMGNHEDSKIADMMIQGNTKGMIQGLKDLHRCRQVEPDVGRYAKNLIDTETANIQKTQPFL